MTLAGLRGGLSFLVVSWMDGCVVLKMEVLGWAIGSVILSCALESTLILEQSWGA